MACPQFLGGPLMYWELVRAMRRPWLHILRFGYAGLLCCQYFLLSADFDAERYRIHAAQRAVPVEWRDPLQGAVWRDAENEARQQFAQDYLSRLLRQQLLQIELLELICELVFF